MSARRRERDRPTVLLVCYAGGHLQQMLALEPAWHDCDRVWVSLRAPDSEHLLANEDVVWAHGPTNRSLRKLVRNIGLGWRTLRRVDPDAVLSTGAGLAVPMLTLARLTGRRAIYVESLTRCRSLSVSGRLVYPFASESFVQWPDAQRQRRHRHVGNILN